jgi:hypothetical protein
MKYTLIGTARILNWVLAGTLLSSAIGGIFVLRDFVWLAATFTVMCAVLLVGVLRRWPFAYVVIATLSLFGLAAALRREDLVLAAGNGAAAAAALFVRGRLLVKISDAQFRSEDTQQTDQRVLDDL